MDIGLFYRFPEMSRREKTCLPSNILEGQVGAIGSPERRAFVIYVVAVSSVGSRNTSNSLKCFATKPQFLDIRTKLIWTSVFPRPLPVLQTLHVHVLHDISNWNASRRISPYAFFPLLRLGDVLPRRTMCGFSMPLQRPVTRPAKFVGVPEQPVKLDGVQVSSNERQFFATLPIRPLDALE